MKRKILIVDDEEIMLVLERRTLSPKYEIVTARSGEEAIKVFEKENPDLILSDLRMPRIDGYELHRILQEKTSEPVPIIFITSDESDASEIKGFAVGAADYIRKPWKPDVLLRRVENIMNNIDKMHGLREAAATDALTGLLNKSAAQNEISALAKKSAGAFLIIDLDNFKLINDIHGHAMGDRILVSFAEIIKNIIRTDDLAGRIGGDEFVVYLQHVNDEKILQEKTAFLNEQILISAKKFIGEEMEIPLGVSVGAVFSPEGGIIFSELYKKADDALYESKKHGKHICSIYGAKTHAEKFFEENSGLSNIRMILGERKIDGAHFVNFENFKMIYRFLVRISNYYGKGLQLLQFTIAEENLIEEFEEVLIKSLRKSDCMTKSGKNKFLVLLPGAAVEDCGKVKDRIFSQLKNFSPDKIIFESEKIF